MAYMPYVACALLLSLVSVSAGGGALASFKEPAPHTFETFNMLSNTLQVRFSYTINGVSSSLLNSSVCLTDDYNQPCLPKLQQLRDTVTVSVRAVTNATTNVTWSLPSGKTFYMVHARLCYSRQSRFNKAWRKLDGTNTVPVWKDKACTQFVGSFTNPALLSRVYTNISKVVLDTWAPGSTYFARAYLYCRFADNSIHYCAMGDSRTTTGHLQIQTMDQQPDWLVGVTIFLMFIGPVLLALCMAQEFLFNKRMNY